MKIQTTLGNGVTITGERQDVDEILNQLEDESLSIDPTVNSGEQWFNKVLHWSENKRVNIEVGQMATPHLLNALARRTGWRVSSDQLDEILADAESRAMLAALADRYQLSSSL